MINVRKVRIHFERELQGCTRSIALVLCKWCNIPLAPLLVLDDLVDLGVGVLELEVGLWKTVFSLSSVPEAGVVSMAPAVMILCWECRKVDLNV